jgi:hypothetical protein
MIRILHCSANRAWTNPQRRPMRGKHTGFCRAMRGGFLNMLFPPHNVRLPMNLPITCTIHETYAAAEPSCIWRVYDGAGNPIYLDSDIPSRHVAVHDRNLQLHEDLAYTPVPLSSSVLRDTLSMRLHRTYTQGVRIYLLRHQIFAGGHFEAHSVVLY